MRRHRSHLRPATGPRLRKVLDELCRRLRLPRVADASLWRSRFVNHPGLAWGFPGVWSICLRGIDIYSWDYLLAGQCDEEGLPAITTDPLQAARWALAWVRARGVAK